jgi:hypothetical protein
MKPKPTYKPSLFAMEDWSFSKEFDSAASWRCHLVARPLRTAILDTVQTNRNGCLTVNKTLVTRAIANRATGNLFSRLKQ